MLVINRKLGYKPELGTYKVLSVIEQAGAHHAESS